jgi:hypothetical protein
MPLPLPRWPSTAALLALLIASSGCEYVLGIERGRVRGMDDGGVCDASECPPACDEGDPSCQARAGEGGRGGDGGGGAAAGDDGGADSGAGGTRAPEAGSSAPEAGSSAPEAPSSRTQVQFTAGGGRVTSAGFIVDLVVGTPQAQTEIRSPRFRLSANPL